MRKAGVLIIGLLMLWGCQEDYFPSGFTSNQITWILAADSSRTWELVRLIEDGNEAQLNDCEDSMHVLFEWRTSTILDAYGLTYQPGCSVFDTTHYGAVTPSFEATTNVFTDTIFFSGGELDYLIIEDIDPGEVLWWDELFNRHMFLRERLVK